MKIETVKIEAIFLFGKKFWKENKDSIIKAMGNVKLSVGDKFEFNGYMYSVHHIGLTSEGVIEPQYVGWELDSKGDVKKPLITVTVRQRTIIKEKAK
jgi:hypothetical protein